MSNENTNIPVNEAPKPGTKDALKAENEALKAELDAMKIRAHAASAGVAKNADDERVEIFVPKGYANDEPNLMIAVNGVNYLLPKGKTSKVPKHIAEEFYRAQKAQEALDKRVDEMLEASK